MFHLSFTHVLIVSLNFIRWRSFFLLLTVSGKRVNEMSGNCISMATRSLLTGVWLGGGSVMQVYE